MIFPLLQFFSGGCKINLIKDYQAERPSEVALFSGILIEKSETYGIDAPVNRVLYCRIKEIEGAYGKET